MESLRRPKEDELEYVGDVMSNFDHFVDKELEEILKKGKAWGTHPAWNFHGDVWFADEKFHEEVWVSHTYRETISADSLRELMEEVNSKYGAQ